jgi:hypothetical protein
LYSCLPGVFEHIVGLETMCNWYPCNTS